METPNAVVRGEILQLLTIMHGNVPRPCDERETGMSANAQLAQLLKSSVRAHGRTQDLIIIV